MTRAIRGAITCQDTKEDIKEATVEMVSKIIKENNLSLDDIAYVNFSATKDIKSAYPAKYLRECLNFSEIPMMCYQEMYVDGSLASCIRVLIVLNKDIKNANHIYLRGASILRPDLKRN